MPSTGSDERKLNEAIIEYYRQIDAGLRIDRQDFMRQYPGLESDLRDFFSNIGILEFGHCSKGSRLNQSSPEVASALPNEETLSWSRVGAGGKDVQEVMLRDYRILECIGQGGMGSVYRAVHVRLQKQVALKTLKTERSNSPESILRFTREMRLLAKLEHANIVRALDAGEHQGLHYFVMELVEGVDLSHLVKRLGPLPIPEASRIIGLAAEALQYAHDKKILHRDVKPSNLMITAQGSVKLLDLGLAHIFEMHLEDQISRMDQAVGTLAYMAPEHLANSQQCSNQSDVFSLGVSLHELLSGKRPHFQASSVPLVADVRSMRPDMNDELCHLLDQMISPSPGDRPQSMAEVAERLSRFATHADLSGLVAEYYRWHSRIALVPTPPPICADTKEISSPKIGTGDTGRGPFTDVQEVTRSGIKSNRRRTISYLLASVVGVAGAALVYQRFFGQEVYPPPPPPPPPDAPLGALEIAINTDDVLSRTLIADGDLRAKGLGEGDGNGELLPLKLFPLKEGSNELPPGRYELLIPGPVDFEPIEFKIAESVSTPILLKALLKNAYFQYPVMPVAREFAAYHGVVWLAGWTTKIPTRFDLYLEVLSNEDQAGRRTKWLKVEVRSYLETGVHQEVGFLKIDANEWDQRQRLSIQEGFVEASGDSIKRFMKDRRLGAAEETFVVKFDSASDLLKELASSTLPEGRLSVQDILALYFGNNNHIAAANETITKLRPSLSENGKRHVWVEGIQLDKGMVPCYVVSSRSEEDDDSVEGWRIARSRENPFEIVELEVNTQLLHAKCTTTVSGVANMDADELDKTLKELANRVMNPADIPAPHPFDLAVMPDKPCSFSASGTIGNSKQSEAIEFTVSMLGIEEVDGKKLHWIELDLKATLPGEESHREIARLLVDADEYPGRTLKLVQGWFAFDNGATVLPLSKNGDLESVIDARL